MLSGRHQQFRSGSSDRGSSEGLFLLLTLTNGASGARQRRVLAGRVLSFDVTAMRFPPAINPSEAPIFSTLACMHPCTPEPPARVWEKVADQVGSGLA